MRPAKTLPRTLAALVTATGLSEVVRSAITDSDRLPLTILVVAVLVALATGLTQILYRRLRIRLADGELSVRPVLGRTRFMPIASIDAVIVAPILKPNRQFLLLRIAIVGIDRRAFLRLNARSWHPGMLSDLLAELDSRVVRLPPAPGHEIARQHPEAFRWVELHPLEFLALLVVATLVFLLLVGLAVIGPP